MNDKRPPLVTIMIPGDLHLTEPELPNYCVANWVVREANELIQPDFVQFIGDNVQHATEPQFQLFRQLATRLSSPWFALVGDHDVHPSEGIRGFETTVGKSWLATSIDGFRFIRLNTQEAKPVGISSEQLTWLQDELTSASQLGERVVLFQHNYAYQIWEEFAGPGIDEWRGFVQSTQIEAIFCGHTHYWQIANDGRNVHIAARSIGDPEGGPAGYVLVCLQGPHLGVTYRTPQDPGPIVVVLAPRPIILSTRSAHVTNGPSEIVAKVWSTQPIATVEASLDGGIPFPLQSHSQGLWIATFDARKMPKGEHQIVLRATDCMGASSEQTIRFPVDPTGRFTSVPCAVPHVSSTNFC